MSNLDILLCSLVILFALSINENVGVNAQSSLPATVTTPIVQTTPGKEAHLSCSTFPPPSSSKIRFCVWERLQQQGKNDHAFIINFNDINSQPGLYSGVAGYSYSGEGFQEGECGVKISFVKNEDMAKWQCTLIADDKIFRGYVDLVRKPEITTTTTKKPASTSSSGVSIASSRTAIDDDNKFDGGDHGRPRPIITSYNDARSIIQPEIVVHSTGANGSPQLIQEVKVESAGLQIKPRRGGKLIVFE